MTSDSIWSRDTLERVLATFVEAFIAALVAAATTGLDMPAVKAAALAGIGAVLAFVKAVAAKGVGSPDSASLDPQV